MYQAQDADAPERIMIVRDKVEVDLIKGDIRLAAKGVRVLGYAIAHDPALRNPAIETFHAKILLADDNKAYIGSANMTRWSRDFSLECGVIIRGPGIKPVATLVEAMMKISEPHLPPLR